MYSLDGTNMVTILPPLGMVWCFDQYP